MIIERSLLVIIAIAATFLGAIIGTIAMGAIIGPLGAIIGATIGAAFGIMNAMDSWDEE